MPITIFQVDAFTDRPFAGNPAAVCLLEKARQADWMQAVAREMNLSETAFLVPRQDGFDLRWFTPAVEVDLCGHATLASAHILYEIGRIGTGVAARFHTRSGLLTARKTAGGIELNFPATPAEPAEPPPGLLDALNVEAIYIGRSKFDYLIQVQSEEKVRSLQPNFNALAKISVRGVMVTASASSVGYDFVSRFFAPAAGVNEDPVTGSAHCCLTPYWSAKFGRDELSAFQASQRGGSLVVKMAGDRVLLTGQAVTVLKCELLVQ